MKKNEKKNVSVGVAQNVAVTKVNEEMNLALTCVTKVANVLAEVDGCPLSLRTRIDKLGVAVIKVRDFTKARLEGLDAKLAKAAKSQERKTDRLKKLIEKQAKLAEEIAKLSS